MGRARVASGSGHLYAFLNENVVVCHFLAGSVHTRDKAYAHKAYALCPSYGFLVEALGGE